MHTYLHLPAMWGQSKANADVGQHNANAMPPRQKDYVREIFYTHQWKQIKNKQQQSTYDAGPKQLANIFDAHLPAGKTIKKETTTINQQLPTQC